MGRNRENTRILRARAQRAYLSRQKELRAPTISETYRAIALAMRDHGRAHFVNAEAPEVRQALLAIMEAAYGELLKRGHAENQIRKRLSLLLRPVPRRKGSAPVASVHHTDIHRALRAVLNDDPNSTQA